MSSILILTSHIFSHISYIFYSYTFLLYIPCPTFYFLFSTSQFKWPIFLNPFPSIPYFKTRGQRNSFCRMATFGRGKRRFVVEFAGNEFRLREVKMCYRQFARYILRIVCILWVFSCVWLGMADLMNYDARNKIWDIEKCRMKRME